MQMLMEHSRAAHLAGQWRELLVQGLSCDSLHPPIPAHRLVRRVQRMASFW